MSKTCVTTRMVGVVCLLCAWAAPVLAQTPEIVFASASPLSRTDVAVNATGTHIAVLTTAAIDPTDTDGLQDLYVRDVAAATWQRVPGASLLRPGDDGLALWGLSDDGRYLGFQTMPSGCGAVRRIDLTTSTIDTLFAFCDSAAPTPQPLPAGYPVGVMSRDGSTFALTSRMGYPVVDPWTLHTVRVGESPLTLGLTCHFQPHQPVLCDFPPALSADGDKVANVDFVPYGRGLLVRDTATGDVTAASVDIPSRVLGPLAGTPDLAWLALPAASRGGVVRPSTGEYDPLTSEGLPAFALTDDAQLVLTSPAPTTPRHLVSGAAMFDRRWRTLTPLHGEPIALANDGHAAVTLVRDTGTWTVTRWVLDADADGLPDSWEQTFGLNPADPSDAGADPNGDGTTTLEAYRGGLHPTATTAARRYLAEGASGSFETRLSLFNPSATPAAVVVALMGADGERWQTAIGLPPFGRTDLPLDQLAAFDASAYSIVVDADHPVVVERRMGLSGRVHASAAAPAASTTWYFAEGATLNALQTFYLLQNPNDAPVDVTLEYLFQPQGREVQTVTLAPRSRTTIWANQAGPAFASAEFALVVHAAAPIVAERSMYRPLGPSLGSSATNAVGVTAPDTAWWFAEGAVGSFFDMFVLVANPGTSPATVTAQFRPEGAPAFSRIFTVPAGARYTIWVDQEGVPPPVTAVSVALTSDAPIVAERVMWWGALPGDPLGWSDGHAEFGATSRGHRFGIADLELDAATGTESFVLVDADTGGAGTGQIRLTAYPSAGAPIERLLTVTDGRNTLWMAALVPDLAGQRFSATVEAVDGPAGRPALSVERALYAGWLMSGAAARATPLDP